MIALLTTPASADLLRTHVSGDEKGAAAPSCAGQNILIFNTGCALVWAGH